jgi:hypothetical protein
MTIEDEVRDMYVKVDALIEQNSLLVTLVRELVERVTYREKILVGWKEIGAYLGVHEQSAHNMGREEVDPLPYDHDFGGHVFAMATALDAWKMRRARKARERRTDGAKAAAATRAGKGGRTVHGDPS